MFRLILERVYRNYDQGRSWKETETEFPRLFRTRQTVGSPSIIYFQLHKTFSTGKIQSIWSSNSVRELFRVTLFV